MNYSVTHNQKQYQEQNSCSNKVRQPFGICMLLGILAFTLGAMMVGCSPVTKADPFIYLSIDFTGYNTNGELEINFDRDSLIKLLIGQEPTDLTEFAQWASLYDDYSNNIHLTCSQQEKLSNGDAVTVSISVTGEAANKVNSGQQTFIVEGLTDVQIMDVFEKVAISFTGVSGDGEVQLSLPSEDLFLKACRFSISPQYYLSTGDIVTVSVQNVDELAEEYGILVSGTSKAYTVAGLYEYLSDPALLSKEEIKAFANRFLSEEANQTEDWGFTFSEPVYYGSYFCTAKHDGIFIDNNVLKIFITYNVYLNGEFYETTYKSMDFVDILVSPEGRVDISYEMGYPGDSVSDMESFLDGLNEDYSVVALDIRLDDNGIVESSPSETEVKPTIPDLTEEDSPQPIPTETTAPSTSNSSASNNDSHIHIFGVYEVNAWKMPTETKSGEIYRFCECGYRDSRTIPSINYNVTDPETGEHICAIYSIGIPATCIEPAYSVKLCTGCDYRIEYASTSTELAKHTYSDWAIIREATATEQGEQSRTCSVCGKVNTEVIPATGEQREYYIDPRITIKKSPDGATSYRYDHLSVVDTRSWGVPPTIRITESEYFRIIYYKQDGTKVVCSLNPVEGYVNRLVILEDGSYTTRLIGDYND